MPLARGRDADVFRDSPGRVLRRYRRPADTAREAAVMAYARERGYPVPYAQAISETDMVLEEVPGPTMLDDLARRPWTLVAHARTLAGLHRRLHRIVAPDWLERFDDGDALLHLDLHPRNVLLGPHGPVVIDWPNARRGAPEADIAYSWLIMATSEIDGVSGRRARLIGALRALFVRAFISHFDRDAVESRLGECARARIADRNVREAERERVRRFARV
jgi:aminoglycoside phosphotransferase (APT) family kinase protein